MKGAVTGIGVDLAEIARIRALAGRNPRFLSRVFTPGELAYCGSSRNRWERLAARFAAKEAVIKALGDKTIALKDIEVVSGPGGKPAVKVKGRPRLKLMLSLSHTGSCACAAVIAFS